MKKLLILIFLVNCLVLNGQKVFLDENGTPILDSSAAKYYKVFEFGNNPDAYKELHYLITGEKVSEFSYAKSPTSEIFVKEGKSYAWYRNGFPQSEINYTNDKLQGKLLTWYENGQLKSEIDYNDDHYNGLVITYWENGITKRKDFFNQGRFENGTCYDSTGKEIRHFDYEIMPSYKGGEQQLLKDIASNLVYPTRSRDSGVEGRVIVRFLVNEDGNISNIGLLQGINPELNNEAMRVVRILSRFKPGYCNGEPVKVFYLVPITFTLR